MLVLEQIQTVRPYIIIGLITVLYNKYRKTNRNQAKSTLRRKKRKNLVAYIRWNTYMSYIRHFPVGINLLLWLCITVTHTLI